MKKNFELKTSQIIILASILGVSVYALIKFIARYRKTKKSYSETWDDMIESFLDNAFPDDAEDAEADETLDDDWHVDSKKLSADAKAAKKKGKLKEFEDELANHPEWLKDGGKYTTQTDYLKESMKDDKEILRKVMKKKGKTFSMLASMLGVDSEMLNSMMTTNLDDLLKNQQVSSNEPTEDPEEADTDDEKEEKE